MNWSGTRGIRVNTYLSAYFNVLEKYPKCFILRVDVSVVIIWQSLLGSFKDEGALYQLNDKVRLFCCLDWMWKMSFEELIDRIKPKLKAITFRIEGACHCLSKDDLYQEAVLQLWIDFSNGKLADKTDSYILQGCYFFLKNHIRMALDKTSLMSITMSFDEDGGKSEEVLSFEEEISIDEGVFAEEVLDMDVLLEEIFKNELSYKEKEVVFFYLQGWTTREIGERLGISHVSVVHLEKKIREKCKKLKDFVWELLPGYDFITCISGQTQ